MKLNIKNLPMVTCISFIFILSNYSITFSEDNTVRAKIGIQIRSDGRYSMAKSRGRLKPGDLLRIYVHHVPQDIQSEFLDSILGAGANKSVFPGAGD